MWFQLSKNVPKSNRKNSQAGNSKKTRQPLGQPRAKGKGVQQTVKSKGKGKGKPKNRSKVKGQGTAANKSQTRSSRQGKKNTSKGRGTGKGKEGRKMEARPLENRKVRNFRRPGDPFVIQSHEGSNDAGLAIAVRLVENQASHLPLQPRDPLC